jgi:hypothetical protein
MQRVLSKEERFRESFPLNVFCWWPSFLYSMYSQESCDKLRETHLRRELASLNQTINKLQKTSHLRKEQPKWRPNKYIYHINNLDGAWHNLLVQWCLSFFVCHLKIILSRMWLWNFTNTVNSNWRCQWESNINVWFRLMYSQNWNCAASLFPKQTYNNVLSPNFHIHVSVSY